MNIKHTQIATAIFALACRSQTAHADGWLLEAGVGYAKAKTSINFPGWFQAQPHDSNTVGTLAAGYGTSFGAFKLSTKLFYIPSTLQAGSTVQDSPFVAGENGNRVQVKLRDTWGISIEPGMAVGTAGLAYLKLGYAQAKANWSFNRPFYPDSYSGSHTFSGPMWGAGYRHNFGSRLYGFAEASRIDYRREKITMSLINSGVAKSYVDKFKPESTQATIGIGWQFD